jgi:hypothetical protein
MLSTDYLGKFKLSTGNAALSQSQSKVSSPIASAFAGMENLGFVLPTHLILALDNRCSPAFSHPQPFCVVQ